MLLTCEVSSRFNTGASFQLWRVLRDSSIVAIAAIGACGVIVSGGVDLSAGSTMGLAAVTCAHLYVNKNCPAAVALLSGFASGGAAGLFNGWLIGRLKMPPFIATLGMLSVARGISYWITGGPNIPFAWEARGETFFGFELLGNQSVGVLLVLAALASIVMARFSWGRAVYAIGGNEEAARFCGLPIERVKTGLYGVAGLFSAFAGCTYALKYGTASVAVGQGYELQIIAACAVGGCSFSGGHGSVRGAVIGAITLQVLRELLLQLNVPDTLMDIAYGCTIWLAVSVDLVRQRVARHS
jgi:ribose transport system permease protein